MFTYLKIGSLNDHIPSLRTVSHKLDSVLIFTLYTLANTI